MATRKESKRLVETSEKLLHQIEFAVSVSVFHHSGTSLTTVDVGSARKWAAEMFLATYDQANVHRHFH